MNINYGIISPLPKRMRGKRNRNLAVSERALAFIDAAVRSEVWE